MKDFQEVHDLILKQLKETSFTSPNSVQDHVHNGICTAQSWSRLAQENENIKMKDLLEAFSAARLWEYVDHRELEKADHFE